MLFEFSQALDSAMQANGNPVRLIEREGDDHLYPPQLNSEIWAWFEQHPLP